jgi:uncharacterized membrane protein YdjX (TVP38/TMEM64 family)
MTSDDLILKCVHDLGQLDSEMWFLSACVGMMQTVLLLQLVPLVPFNVLNYLLSITPVSTTNYVLALWIGMMVRLAFLLCQMQ